VGQTIEVTPQQVGAVVIFDTDRSITGQDGSGYTRSEAGADEAAPFPARLAARLFAGVDDLDHIWIASNQVVVERQAGWTDTSIAEAAEIISQFFRFYPD
jgi:hypothetical protein